MSGEHGSGALTPPRTDRVPASDRVSISLPTIPGTQRAAVFVLVVRYLTSQDVVGCFTTQALVQEQAKRIEHVLIENGLPNAEVMYRLIPLDELPAYYRGAPRP